MTTRQITVIDAEPESDGGPPAPWWRRRRWQVLAVALVLAAASGVAVAGIQGGAQDLPRDPPRTSYVFHQLEPGAAFSMGGVRIFEPGKTVRILSAKALTSSTVEYLGAYTVWPRDFAPPVGSGEGFPYPAQAVRHELSEPIPGSETDRFQPGWLTATPVLVTLGFRILSGMGGVNGIHLTYKVDGKAKSQYFPQATIACVKPLNCKDDDLTRGSRGLRELGLVK